MKDFEKKIQGYNLESLIPVICRMENVPRGIKFRATHVVISQIVVGIFQPIVENSYSHASTSYPQSIEG